MNVQAIFVYALSKRKVVLTISKKDKKLLGEFYEPFNTEENKWGFLDGGTKLVLDGEKIDAIEYFDNVNHFPV